MVPLTIDLVERNVQGLLAGLVQLDDNAVHVLVAERFERGDALVASDDAAGGLIPDDRFDVTELVEGAFEFVELRIPRF